MAHSHVVCDGDSCRLVYSDEKEVSKVPENSALIELLGDKLQKQGTEISTSSICGSGKIIGLYFSAHWCPPCRGFTPILMAWYQKFKETHPNGNDFEIVFVSSDRDEKGFDEYYSDMPWSALPFSQRELKFQLSKKFKINGIPSLVIIDGETGSLITAKGREVVTSDEHGEGFPWKPAPLSQYLYQGQLVDKAEKLVSAEETLKGKIKLLYFSAHWCPPCRAFTPKLAETYTALKASGKSFELVFVSGDRDQKSFSHYVSEMPWLAIPFSERNKISKLNDEFDVDGIPTLLVLDENDQIITEKGRAAVEEDPQGLKFPWYPELVEELDESTSGDLNSYPVVLLIAGGGDRPAAVERSISKLKPAAEVAKASVKSSSDRIVFMFGLRGDELVQRVLEFTNLESIVQEDKDALILLDVPSQVVFDSGLVGDAISAASVNEFVGKYRSNGLKSIALE